MSQNYGALRIVGMRVPAGVSGGKQERYHSGWLPEERLVHLLIRKETSVGRALNNDIVLMDPTISREHARLVLDEHGWRIFNLTRRNVVRVNGSVVTGGSSLPLRSQDFVLLGNTTLQMLFQHPTPDGMPEGISIMSPSMPTNGHYQGKSGKTLNFALGTFYSSLITSITTRDQQLGRSNGNGKTSIPHTLYAGEYDEPVGGLGVEGSLSPPTPEEPVAREPEEDWESQRESLIGVTMQFALPRKLGGRTRWIIAGICLAVLLLSVVVTIVLNNVIGISFSKTGIPNVLAALSISLIPALGISLLVSFIDRYEREPWFLRLAAFLWGAVIAIPSALLIELNVERALLSMPGQNDLLNSLFKGLNAGITEETVKGLGLLLLFLVLRDEFDNVTDGIVYGALIGAGFAMVENFVYFSLFSKEYLVFLIVGRVMLGWLCHSTFTVCFGAALGYVRHTRVRWRQILIPLFGYMCAVGLHSAFDFINAYANALLLNYPDNTTVTFFSLLAIIGNYIPPFIAQIALVYILIKALVHEGAVIREFLASEVSSGIVLVDEYALLQNSFQRTKVERRVLWQSGFKQWMRVRALYQTQIGLAFRKWHVNMGDRPKLGYMQPEDAYRRRIKRLRQEIVQGELELSPL